MTATGAPVTPETLAHIAVAVAIASGRLPAKTICAIDGCGKPSKHYHHHSYLPEHQLDVVQLCRQCHGKVHAGKIPEPLTGELRTGARRKQPTNGYGRDDSALFAVLRTYPRIPPFMRRDRWAEVSAFVDRECPVPWRELLSARRVAGDRSYWDPVWDWARVYLTSSTSFIPSAPFLSSSAHPAWPAISSAPGEPTTLGPQNPVPA